MRAFMTVEVDGVAYPEVVVEFDQDVEEVYSDLPERDPDWSFTDSNGHVHEYVTGEESRLRCALPETVVRVVDGAYWCEGCRDEYEDWHFECTECGDEVTPGMRPPSMWPQYVPGPSRYTIKVPALVEGGMFVARLGDETVIEVEVTPVSHVIGTDGSETTLVGTSEPYLTGRK